MVLYHCCVSLGMALELVGFMDDELIPVTEHPPSVDKTSREQASSLTVLVKSRHYAHFFKQEVSLDEGSAGV